MGQAKNKLQIRFIFKLWTASSRSKNRVWIVVALLYLSLLGSTAQTENVTPKIKYLLESAKAKLSGDGHKVLPVVDLVQVVKRPLKSTNSVLQIIDKFHLTFKDTRQYSLDSLFFLVRYETALPGEELSNGLWDVSLSKFMFLNTTTQRLAMKPLNDSTQGTLVNVLKVEGPFSNCNLKLTTQNDSSITRRPSRRKMAGRRWMSPREWWLVGREGEDEGAVIRGSSEKKGNKNYYQIRKLGHAILNR